MPRSRATSVTLLPFSTRRTATRLNSGLNERRTRVGDFFGNMGHYLLGHHRPIECPLFGASSMCRILKVLRYATRSNFGGVPLLMSAVAATIYRFDSAVGQQDNPK